MGASTRPRRCSFTTGLAIAIMALAVAAGCATSGGGGGGGGTPPPTAPNVCPAKGAGEIQVAVVVDMTAYGLAPAATCVVVPTGSTGVAALAARAQRLGTPAPRYAPNGLLCAIDGVPPAPACGQNGPNGPEYWSYWTGGSSWIYAPTGPATRGLTDQSVDGWRFIPGGANQAPGMSPSFAVLTAP